MRRTNPLKFNCINYGQSNSRVRRPWSRQIYNVRPARCWMCYLGNEKQSMHSGSSSESRHWIRLRLSISTLLRWASPARLSLSRSKNQPFSTHTENTLLGRRQKKRKTELLAVQHEAAEIRKTAPRTTTQDARIRYAGSYPFNHGPPMLTAARQPTAAVHRCRSLLRP